MTLIGKLLAVPFVAFFLMMFSVGLIGGIYDVREMPWLFPNNNAWPVYLIWLAILAVIVPLHHFLKRKNDD